MLFLAMPDFIILYFYQSFLLEGWETFYSFNLKFVVCTGNKIGHTSLFKKSDTKQNQTIKKKPATKQATVEKIKSVYTEHAYKIYPT